MNQQQYGGSLGGPIVREPHVLLRQRRAAAARSDRPGHDLAGQRRGDQRAAGGRRLSGPAGRPRASIRIRSTRTNFLGKVDHQFSGRDQLERPLQPLRRQRPSNSRGAGGAERAERVGRPRQPRSDDRLQQHADAVVADGQRDARAVRPRRPEGAAHRSRRAGRQHRRRGLVRHALGQSDRPREHDVPGRQQPVAPGRRACAPGRRRFPLQRRHIAFRASVRGSYTFSSLANFLTGVYNNAGFTQTFGDPWCRRPIRTSASTCRTNGRSAASSRSTWACATTCSSSRRSTPTPTTCRRASGSPGRRSTRGGRSCAAAPACSTIACRCARWPTRCCRPATPPISTNLRQISISLSPTQAGAPVFPKSCRGVVPSVTLVNLTTMDRDLQNAYSRQASIEVEQQLGERATVSVGYQYLRGVNLLMSVNQNVPTCVARHQQRLPAESDLRQQQPVLVGRRVDLSRPARLVRAAAGAWGALPRVLHAVEVDEQRRRVLLQLADRSLRPVEGLGPLGRRPASPSRGQRRRQFVDGAGDDGLGAAHHGFQVSSMLQAYSALPFNITSGVTTVQGTPGRPIVGRRVHRGTECRHRQRFLQPEPAGEPGVPLGRASGSKAGRGVQPDQPRNTDAQHEFRRRCVSDQSVADVRPGDGGRRTQIVSVRYARALLTHGR